MRVFVFVTVECELVCLRVCVLALLLFFFHGVSDAVIWVNCGSLVSSGGRVVDLPGNRLGTSLMAGRPVPLLEERGVVEWTEGDAMGLRYGGYVCSYDQGGEDWD